jgi:benzylsuccinate CoA-transferase BbsF subunit
MNSTDPEPAGPATGVGSRQPLEHVRICDFTGQLAGAGATRFLAAMGAQVIRIEDPVRQGRWDILRGAPPYPPGLSGLESGGAFNNHNVEKLGVTLNVKTDTGRQLLSELIAVSDVVTENFAAGVMDRWGFGWPELQSLKPDLIYVSNCGFGHSGPYESFKTWGPIVQAICGLTYMSGLPDMPPAGYGLSYMDHHGASYMAVAVLAGLIHRNRTGEGQWIDMACTEAGATMCGPATLDWSVNGRPTRRSGMPNSTRSESPPMAPHGIYPCRRDDDWIAIACRTDGEWRLLADTIEEAWSADPALANLAGRIDAQDAIDAHLAAWTGPQERQELVASLRERGVTVAAVARPQERIDEDPLTAAWGLWPEVEHPVMDRVRVDGIPIHLSETDWSIETGAPLLGQHNQEVFGTLLGHSDDDLAQWAAEGVL